MGFLLGSNNIGTVYLGSDMMGTISVGENLIYGSNMSVQPEPYLPYEYFYFKTHSPIAQVSIAEETEISTGSSTTPPIMDKTHFNNYEAPTFEYSYDKETWQTYTLGTTITLSKNSNSIVYFRGNNIAPWYDTYATSYSETHDGTTSDYTHYHYIWIQAHTLNGMVKSGGNLLSLRDASLSDITTIPCDYAFSAFFLNCVNLITPPILSATNLKNYCYSVVDTTYASVNVYGLFSGCKSLVTAPELPATSLTIGCYANMFYGCISLTVPPELPATTLAAFCYGSTVLEDCGMFSYCTSLIIAPELSATTLADYCYASMFYKCISLTTPPELSATTLADYCYAGMFAYSGITQTPKLSATTLTNGCYGGWLSTGMFQGCKNLTKITTLPALTIGNTQAYYGMFKQSNVKANATSGNGCTYAYRVPTSGTGTADSKSLTDMFTNAADTTTNFTPTVNTTFYINVPSF